jgi:hypothetical protein
MSPIHWSWCRSFEINSFAVVATAVARTFELVLACLPVWSAAEVGAACIDHEQPIRRFGHPDAILLLPLRVDAETVIIWRSDSEDAGGFENGSR